MELSRKIKNKLISYISIIVSNCYERHVRRKIKNKDFTILCSNCIGGVIYNRLGMKFLSPTINLWLTQADFIKFATNLKQYISLELEFLNTDKNYPVAQLGDIVIHFNHSKKEEEARRDWDRRKARINYDNIYIIMYWREGYSLEDIRKIEKADCKNLVVLSDVNIDLEYVKVIKPNTDRPSAESFLDMDTFGLRTFEKRWDYVSWLNLSK